MKDATSNNLRSQFDSLVDRAYAAIERKNESGLKRAQEKIKEIYRDILFQQPAFWIGFLQELKSDTSRMSNPVRGEQLYSQGLKYVQQNNIDGVRRTVVEMLQLLPRDVADKIQRGYGAGIVL